MPERTTEPCACQCAATGGGELGPRLPVRRQVLERALATGLTAIFAGRAFADDQTSMCPQAGDLFVFVSGNQAAKVIGPDGLPLSGPPVLGWPMEIGDKTVRDASRPNQVLLVRLEESSLDETTRVHLGPPSTATAEALDSVLPLAH
jgi:hypothetical protein